MEERVKKLLEKHKDDEDLTTEKDYIKPGLDWSGADLSGWNLGQLTLSNCDNKANFEKVNLMNANLQEANLERANLQEASLPDANLQKAVLGDANLQKAFLLGANLQEASLGGANLQEANLMSSSLRDAKFNEETALQNANIFQCRLENSTLKNAYKQLDKIVIQEREKKYSEAKEVYLMLKNYFRQEGMYDISGEYYYREKLMEKKLHRQNKRWIKWIGNNIYHGLSGYGEHPLLVLLWWCVIILFFGYVYWGLHGLVLHGEPVTNPFDFFYFSVVTFTTLGFGDIQPNPDMTLIKIFAMTEALLGAFMMALFVLTFGRKMIR